MANFEYGFFFLFRTSLPVKEGEPIDEPLTIANQKKPTT